MTMTEPQLYRITSARFVAGLDTREFDEGRRVFNTAPILRFMTGWTEEKMLRYCKTKGWTVEPLSKEKHE
jgi:hypothetical protein